MRFLLAFCLFSVALAQPGGLEFLKCLQEGGTDCGVDGGDDGGAGGGLLGGGDVGPNGPSAEIIRAILGPCRCGRRDRPRGKTCMDQMKNLKDCVKDRIGDDVEGMMPSEDERMEMEENAKALKKDILDSCFASPCQDPREAIRKFGACMKPKVTRRGGVLPRFKRCLRNKKVGIPKKLREKAAEKAQKLFAKMMGKEGDDEVEEDEEEGALQKIGMLMARGGRMENKLQMLEKLAEAICPQGRRRRDSAADSAVRCVREKIELAKQNQPSRSSPRPNPMVMIPLVRKARPCTCLVSSDCKDKMEKVMGAVCTCKANINQKKLASQALKCAKEAGINVNEKDITKKIKSKLSKLSQMCDAEKKEKIKAAMECSSSRN